MNCVANNNAYPIVIAPNSWELRFLFLVSVDGVPLG